MTATATTREPTPDVRDPDRRVRIAVIIGSVRTGRFGPVVARWFTGELTGRDDVTADVVDLVDLDLPPSLDGNPQDPHDPVAGLAERLAGADAFVVVTPEYNHSFPAGLKTAIDSVHAEWAAKPVGFVSYGGRSGGLRAVEHLRGVFVELHAAPVRDGVSLHDAGSLFDDEGRPTDDGAAATAAATLADRLVWWGRALRAARDRTGYPG